MSSRRLLFVTWDGPQVSYLESLYMPVFERLAVRGVATHVLQFTWADEARRQAIRRVCEAGGITYHSVPVLRRPVAAGGLATAMLGSRHVARELQRHRIDVVMPRSTLPALSTMRALCRFPEVRMVFDADGLPHDERVDFGGWSAQGLPYRLLRDIEASAVRRADIVLTRSHRAAQVLASRAGPGATGERFRVVGNGRDPERFHPGTPRERSAVREEIGVDEAAPLVVYAGSVGDQYCLPEMLDFFRRVHARRPDSRFLLLTGSPAEALHHVSAQPDVAAACIVRQAAAADVPRLLAAGHLGVALRRPTFSMQAVAPIKLGEYLLCGLPVLATRGIGDSEALLPESVGRLLDAMEPASLEAAAAWFIDDVLASRDAYRDACRTQGLRCFGIDAMVDAYAAAIAPEALGA